MSGTTPSPMSGFWWANQDPVLSHTGLDFVEDEKGPGLAGEFTNLGEVAGRVLPDSDLALDGFDEDGGSGVVDSGGERLDVSVGNMDDAGYSGGEGFAVGGLGRQCECTHGAAVEGALDGNDDRAAPTPSAAGHLEGGFIGFGAGVGEEHGRTAGQVEDLVEFLSEGDLRW